MTTQSPAGVTSGTVLRLLTSSVLYDNLGSPYIPVSQRTYLDAGTVIMTCSESEAIERFPGDIRVSLRVIVPDRGLTGYVSYYPENLHRFVEFLSEDGTWQRYEGAEEATPPRKFPGLTASEIVSVQPMSLPTGSIYFLEEPTPIPPAWVGQGSPCLDGEAQAVFPQAQELPTQPSGEVSCPRPL